MNNNWQHNLQVIARGGGSIQARSHEDCPICNENKDEDEDEEIEYSNEWQK